MLISMLATVAMAAVPSWQLATELGEVNFNSLGAGMQHSCVINPATERIWCTGEGGSGRLGMGSQTDLTTWTIQSLPSGVSGWAQIVGGGSHSCAVSDVTGTSNPNRLYCWGRGQEGQVGNGLGTQTLSPARAVMADTGLFVEDVLHVSTGSSHTIVVHERGWLFSTGENGNTTHDYQLGIGLTTMNRYGFTFCSRYGAVDLNEFVCNSSSGIHVATTESTSTVVDADTYSYSSGSQSVNEVFKLGFNDALKPEPADSFQYAVEYSNNTLNHLDDTTLPGFIQLDGGSSHMCGIIDVGPTLGDDIGQVYCWGQGDRGRLGYGDTEYRSAIEVRWSGGVALDIATKVAAGYAHTCALRYNGQVACWGARDNSDSGNDRTGMLGDGYNTGEMLYPTEVIKCASGGSPLTNVVNIDVQGGHSLASVYEGGVWKVYAWGDNKYGQLGDGSYTDSNCAKLVKTF